MRIIIPVRTLVELSFICQSAIELGLILVVHFRHGWLIEIKSTSARNGCWWLLKRLCNITFCNCSMFCCALLCVYSSFGIILMGKRELID